MTAASVSEFVNNYTGDVKFAGNDVAFEGFDFAAIEEDLKDRKYSKGLFQKSETVCNPAKPAFRHSAPKQSLIAAF